MKYYVESYGCTLNQGETEMIAESFGEEYQRVDTPEEADLSIIGTCVVIKKTEERMKRRIRELKSLSDEVLVTGCLSSTSPEAIKDICPKAEMVSPGDMKMRTGPFVDGRSERIGTLPISSGCIGSCSYCITKQARGALESRDPRKIKERFKNLVSSGTKEIRITCQDTASFGIDRKDYSLPSLLRELVKIEGDYRIRIGMMNPDTSQEILDELIPVMKNEHIYDFLHLPLQSGSNNILKRMNRNYRKEDWMDIVRHFRDSLTDLTLSTDIIVGFPGEDEKDFKKSKDVLKEIRPDIVNVTRFSPRPGTEAIEMDDKIHSRIKKKRSKELTQLRLEMSGEINEKYVGREEEALFLEEGKGDSIKGRMDNYKVVVLKKPDEDLLGKRVPVKIIEAEDVYLVGRLLD